MIVYQVTIEVPNRDWTWRNWDTTFHDACARGLDLAEKLHGRLISVTKMQSDRIRPIEIDQ